MEHAAHELNAAGHKTQALETLKLLTFMDSAWQPYNSYAEVLMINGTEAKLLLQKSLSLNPNNLRQRITFQIRARLKS